MWEVVQRKENICNFIKILPVKVLTGNRIILGLGKGDMILVTKSRDRLVQDDLGTGVAGGLCIIKYYTIDASR